MSGEEDAGGGQLVVGGCVVFWGSLVVVVGGTATVTVKGAIVGASVGAEVFGTTNRAVVVVADLVGGRLSVVVETSSGDVKVRNPVFVAVLFRVVEWLIACVFVVVTVSDVFETEIVEERTAEAVRVPVG